uniref:PAS domain-containing sensor histidine kinase n=1 Tax=Pararhizobium sp. IMCC3301 TaxID=3067904 RepID=UPI00274173B1|nr:PAS domain-containing hybrid sensor histidine kinase/response regulator [Pararhizobium sp. IMCC3301]
MSKRRDNRAFMAWTACEPLSTLVLSGEPALVLSPDGGQLLWANPAGAQRLGADDLETLLSEEFPQDLPLRKQIRHLYGWLRSDREQVQRLRLGRSAATPLEMVTVSKLRNMDGVSGVLLRPASVPAASDFDSRADLLANWLGSGHHYAALLSASGDVIASSGAFSDLRHAAETLQTLLEDAADSVAPVSQQINIQSGMRHLITALKLPVDKATVFLLLVDAEETPLQRVVQQGQPGRMAASAIRVPTPANDTRPQQLPLETPVSPQPLPQEGDSKRSEPDLMRFVWRMDEAFKFTFVSPEFQTLVSLRGAFEGRSWQDLAGDFQLDPSGDVQAAIASKDSWSGKQFDWRLPKRSKVAEIELSAMPVFDAEKRFLGYRGFGACQLRAEHSASNPGSSQNDNQAENGVGSSSRSKPTHPADTASVQSGAEIPAIIDTRPASSSDDVKSGLRGLTAEERRAFEEIGKSLGKKPFSRSNAPAADQSGRPPHQLTRSAPPVGQSDRHTHQPANAARPNTEAATERALRTVLDQLQTGILVVREDKLLFANKALAGLAGYDDAGAFLAADATALMSGFSLDRVGDSGVMQFTGRNEIAHSVRATIGRIDWAGRPASLLIVEPVDNASDEAVVDAAQPERREDEVWNAEELLSILNTATEGVLMIDVEGRILALNHGAEALFDEHQASLIGRDMTALLAPESHKTAHDYLAGITGAGVASILNDGREVIGQTAKGGYMPLFMTMGRVGEEASGEDAETRLCVVLRDITQWKRAEDDLIAARHSAEKASTAKSDFLAKISHEIRTPLNAILGFSEVMLEERFGPIGNPRYKDYINDIHTSGAHVINLVNDMLDISKIEAGQLEMSFTAVDLVEILKECVALMQPQANDGRVIIRTSFSEDLPRVVADAKTLRQIALNLLSNSIKFTAEGGQVIVSAVVEKDGSLILRVRDTGIGMSEADLATAMEPFRQLQQIETTPGNDRMRKSSVGTGLGLPLTKALVEANRAQFLIESTPAKGTLIRVIFPNTRVLAE